MKTFPRLLRVYSHRYPVAQARYHVPKAALLALLYRSIETGTTYLLDVQQAQAVEFAGYSDSVSHGEIGPRWLFTMWEGEF